MKRRLQVFISSTYIDLIEERQAAVSAILKSGHIPAGMELFTSGDQSQMDIIKKWIDESDVYMLILGGRYGSIEPTTGMSYTELEYDYATQQSKPLFAVVITELALEKKIKEKGSSFLEKDNYKELTLFRKKVLSNVSSFFDDFKDIKLCVHESLADFSSNRNLSGWVPGDEVTDTKPLFEEIKKLSDENKQLKDLIAKKEQQTELKNSKITDQYGELSEILRAIEIKIPAALANGVDKSLDLLSIFYKNKEIFINGLTNAPEMAEVEAAKFFYYNVCPKLQIHGIMVNEKITGVRYRRYSITKEGTALLAYQDRQLLRSKKENEEKTKITPISVVDTALKDKKVTRVRSTRSKKN